MGFLTSSIQVRARHARCAEHWRPHLERTRAAILGAAQCASGRRLAVVLGAGHLNDIPLKELSSMFEEVRLVDVVHSLRTRAIAMRYSNVKLHTLDITNTLDELLRCIRDAARPLPIPVSEAFMHEEQLDFCVSVNLLSQLPWVPGRYLKDRRPETEVRELQLQLVKAHLDYLRRLPGHTALITDVRWRSEPAGTSAAVPVTNAGEHSALHSSGGWNVVQGMELPKADAEWDWLIAPAPEQSPDLHYIATVHAYLDWKRTSACAASNSEKELRRLG